MFTIKREKKAKKAACGTVNPLLNAVQKRADVGGRDICVHVSKYMVSPHFPMPPFLIDMFDVYR